MEKAEKAQQCKLLKHKDLEWWRRRESTSKVAIVPSY